MLTLPAVAEKAAEVEPCGTVTVAGRFATAGDELRVIVAPPLSAADVSATVQVDPMEGVNVVGVHENVLRIGVWRIVTVVPLTEVGMAAPTESADTALES